MEITSKPYLSLYKFKYEYDKKHNVTKGTSAMGVVNRLVYDGNGNITKSGTVQPDAQDKGIWIARSFTTDKNHVASVTDAEGNRTLYDWNVKSDLLNSLTDGQGNRLSYKYDSADRMTSVSQEVTADGTKQVVKNTYGYTKDKLTSIDHNGFRYGFEYDAFGNTTAASIAGSQVVQYIYESGNGNLSRTVYANGNEIRYTYDSQDRMTESYFRESSGGTEQKLNTYTYDKEGNLCRVVNHMAGKTYDLDYDFLDRLMRVRDEKGSFYEYTYDATNHMTKLIHKAGVSHTTILYTYDKDGREQTTKVRGGYTKTSTYDKLGRAAGVTLSTKKAFAVKVAYPAANGNQEHAMPSGLTVGDRKLTYQYDKNGNITRIQDRSGSGAVKTDTFCYDERNQLIREDSQTQNKTFVYEYDLGGNLTEVKEYAYTAGELPAFPERTETGSYASVWKDQLVNWNGTAMTYDAIGNMLTRGNITYRWIMGRKLAGVNNGKNIQYFYDHTGSRTKKVVDGTATEYRMAGELLVSEITNGQTFWYTYDSNANLVSIIIGGKNYFYVRNLQNDIIALIDEDGNTVVNYTYDSWGKILSITGSLKDTVGQQNPFRYRGYYYDKETGMYYLKNRYYDPELRRFICADKYLISANSVLTNLYAYCGNSPTTSYDPDGKFFKKAFGFVKKVWNATKKAVKKVCSVVKRTYRKATKALGKVFGVQLGTSNGFRYKAGISGVGSVAYSHSTGFSGGYNPSAVVTFYSNAGNVTTYEPFNSSGDLQTESDNGVNINIGFVQASVSSEVLTGELIGLSSSVSVGDYSLGANCHYNHKDQSIGISLGISKSEENNMDISDEISLDLGIPAIVGVVIGMAAGTVGKVVQAIF
ncbi:hypothetical protein F170042I7_35950 [Blautia caecimuris]|uniref:RHS repeat domain-containing protein n=1 Tax=Blautia caecimuris TaxID=1796615 RepID=UPI0034BDA71B